jgi:hypothetical protein
MRRKRRIASSSTERSSIDGKGGGDCLIALLAIRFTSTPRDERQAPTPALTRQGVNRGPSVISVRSARADWARLEMPIDRTSRIGPGLHY